MPYSLICLNAFALSSQTHGEHALKRCLDAFALSCQTYSELAPKCHSPGYV
ncbi:hypothetical protein V6Z11_A13G173500 [Gossypium hirsutum]